jgi:hypothetical protein
MTLFINSEVRPRETSSPGFLLINRPVVESYKLLSSINKGLQLKIISLV